MIGSLGVPDMRQSYSIVGKTINLASRIQSYAEKHSLVLVDHSTYDVLRRKMRFSPNVHRVLLKGWAEPQMLHQPEHGMLEKHSSIGRHALLGRELALSAFVAVVDGACHDHEASLLLFASPSGMGKSCLLRHLHDAFAAHQHHHSNLSSAASRQAFLALFSGRKNEQPHDAQSGASAGFHGTAARSGANPDPHVSGRRGGNADGPAAAEARAVHETAHAAQRSHFHVAGTGGHEKVHRPPAISHFMLHAACCVLHAACCMLDSCRCSGCLSLCRSS